MSLLDKAISLTLPAVPRAIVGRFSRRYIAGTTIDDAFRVVDALHREGAMSTIDILGEFITTPEEARGNVEAYEQLFHRIHDEDRRHANVSVKLTSLGLLVDRQACLDHMRRLVELAERIDSFVRIDMEDSACTSSTLAIYETLRRERPGRVGTVLQSRLRRTIADVERLAGEPTNIRLCKGIYLEPRSIAYTGAELIRRSFSYALELLFEHGAYVGIATHDELLVQDALHLIRRFGLRPERYEFQMLLGVDEQLRRILIEGGHRLRVYVPYGEQWYQYSVRRLRENPQIAGYALRSLFRRRPA